MNRIPGSVLYDGLVDVGQISPDQSQYAVLALLDQLADKLVSRKHWNGDRKVCFVGNRGSDQNAAYIFGVVWVAVKHF